MKNNIDLESIKNNLRDSLGDDKAFCEQLAREYNLDLDEIRGSFTYPEGISYISGNLHILNINSTRHFDSWVGLLGEFGQICYYLVAEGYSHYLYEPAPSDQEVHKFHFIRDDRKLMLSYRIEESFDKNKYYNLEDIKKSIERQFSKNLRKTKIFRL